MPPMDHFSRLNRLATRAMSFMVPALIVLAVAFPSVLGKLQPISTPVFFVIVFAGSSSIRLRDIVRVARHPAPLVVLFVVAHVLMPLLAWGVAHLFFTAEPDIVVGMILEFLTPTAASGFAWVVINRGDVALSLVAVFLDTLITPVLLPVSLHLLTGSRVEVGLTDLMSLLVVIILLPALLGLVVNESTRGRFTARLGVPLQLATKVAIWVVIAAAATKIAHPVRDLNPMLLGVTLAMLLISLTGYALGFAAALVMKASRAQEVSYTYGAGLRNINLGAVVAASYFPDLTVFPVIITMLFQQVTAASIAAIARSRWRS